MKLILRTEYMDAKMENYIIRIRVTVVDEEPLLEVELDGVELGGLPQEASAGGVIRAESSWVASRESILEALDGQIGDADANASRYPADSLRRAELIVTRDTLKGVKRMMERKARA